MTMAERVVYVVILSLAAFDHVSSASVLTTLHVANGGRQGNWGPEEFCPANSYADGFWLKVHICYESQPGCDDAGVTGLALRCSHPDGRSAGYIGSRYGASFHPKGRWQALRTCKDARPLTFISGFALKVQEYRLNDGDNTAVNNIRFTCSNGEKPNEDIEGKGLKWSMDTYAGDYGTRSKNCPPGIAVCGLSIRVDQQADKDNTGLNDVKLYCCGSD